MKRIFIAIKVHPGETLTGMISEFKRGLKDEAVKWTETENIHVTLFFLGNTEEKTVAILGEMLKKRCSGSGSFELLVRGAGVFKNMRDPRVIWTGIEKSEELLNLHTLIIRILSDLHIETEDRPYSPHLTLGRIKSLSGRDALAGLITKYMDREIQKMPVNEVILYESITGRTGPVYKPLGVYRL